MRTKVFLLLLILFAATAWSQNINVKGRILETSSQPVPFATVSLLRPDSTLVTGTTSDLKGYFAITGLKKGDYLLSVSYVGYIPTGIELKNLERTIEVGDVILQEASVVLNEVTVSASNITQKIDRQIILPTESQLKRSFGAYDLLNNMMISRLQVDPLMNSISISGGGNVQVRINGVKISSQELAAVRAKDVQRIEYIEDPGKRYGDDSLGAVINIILKQRETGGRINLQAMNSPHVLWGENFLSGKFNYKNSEWGIDYFNKNSKMHFRKELTEHYDLGNQVVDRIQEGVDDASKSLKLQNNINLSYNLTKSGKYVFNAVFRNSIENTPYNNQLNRMYEADSNDYIFSRSKSHTSTYSPSLDLYYQLSLPHDQTLEVNLTGTLINSTSNRQYSEFTRSHEDLAGILTYVDGKKRSVIGEAVYDKSFQKVKLSAGIRHYQMRAENTYTGTIPAISEMDQSQSSAFFELQGKVKDFTYAGSVGMTRAWFKEGGEAHQYYTFTPTVRLGLNLHKAGFLRYRFNISPSIPSLSSLTDVEQALDTIQIVRGNPLLKTFQKYSNSLNYSLSFKKVGINLSARHNYYDKPIMESVFVENGKLVMMDDNQRYFQSLNFELGVNLNALNIGNLKDFLSLGASFGYTDTWSRGNNYNHRYDNFYYNIFASLQYKQFMLMGQFRKFQNSLYGETIKKGENQTALMLAYARKNFQLGAGVMFPFTNNYRTGEERISTVAPYSSWQYVKEAGRMFMLRLSYGIEFGRKHKAGNKKLNNEDKETGIINTDR